MQTRVMPCDCTELLFIVVKQAGAATDKCPRWEQPWFARKQGAQFQDEQYGKGQRLHSKRMKDSKAKGWTCSVCGRQKAD